MTRYLYLESEGVYRKLLRVSRTKNIITGSFFNSYIQVYPGLKDLHFTYPPPGNYHVTVVCSDGTEYRIYSNSATKRCAGRNDREQIDRESLPFTWRMFVPEKRMRPSFHDFQNDPTKSDSLLAIGIPCVPLTGPSETPRTSDAIFRYELDPEKKRMVTLNVSICGSKYNFNPTNPDFPKPVFEHRDQGNPEVLIHFF
jgi:hypothetical protein